MSDEAMKVERRAALALGVGALSLAALGGEAEAKTAGGVKVTVLYGHPKSPADFEKYYRDTHLPIARKIKGVKKLELAKCLPGADGKAPPYYRIAEIWFSSPEQMQKSLGSPEGKATTDDIPNFATGGVTVMVSDIT